MHNRNNSSHFVPILLFEHTYCGLMTSVKHISSFDSLLKSSFATVFFGALPYGFLVLNIDTNQPNPDPLIYDYSL